MITLTDTAAVKVKELLAAEGEPGLALRVAVRPGGCSGFSYEMFFDGDIEAEDQQLSTMTASASSSILPAPRCSSAPRSTTRTACSRLVSRSTTRTPRRAAAAASRSADRSSRRLRR